MAWITPKTNWTKDDYFNITDFNRIRNNIIILEDLSRSAVGSLVFLDMPDEKEYLDNIYADEINDMHENVKMINVYGIADDIRNYEDNGKFMTFDELNKLESIILELYVTMKTQLRFIQHLPIKLGNSFYVARQI